MENAKKKKDKSDILSNFQTLCIYLEMVVEHFLSS